MTPFTLTIAKITESQNVRDRWHFMVRNRERQTWCQHLMVRRTVAMHVAPGEHRYVTITSFRPRLITDHANLVGGAKGLVDAIVKAQLLVDDNDKLATIDYRQFTASFSPMHGMRLYKKSLRPGFIPCTTIHFSDMAPIP